MVRLLSMTGPRVPIPAEPADHPLRAALMRGDLLLERSGPALLHRLGVRDDALLGDAIVAHVGGMIGDIARQLGEASDRSVSPDPDLWERLARLDGLREHCHALALEWRLTLALEAGAALDPVLSPMMQAAIAWGEGAQDTLAMAALAAQARYAQAQRRMQHPLGELPAELFDEVLRAALAAGAIDAAAEAQLRRGFEEGDGRLALIGRLVGDAHADVGDIARIEDAGLAVWLSAVSARTGQTRDRVACAAADPQLGRLLLTLRAAGLLPGEAERQALLLHPDAVLPRGLHDVGTREAAQWLAQASA